ncbi:MAG: DEAD/DEAH box helicase [Candidatus Thorarchaeota archaeon]
MADNSGYEWQNSVVKKWESNGFEGIIKAVTGAGKTRAGRLVKEYVRSLNPNASILVIAPQTQVLSQWGSELNDGSVMLLTYQGAVKLLRTENPMFDLIIYDECHKLLSKVMGKAINLRSEKKLGLSATPMESVELLGGIIVEVGWDEAKTSPFNLYYMLFNLDYSQQQEYRVLTQKMKNALKRKDMLMEEGMDEEFDIMEIIMLRRSFVYNLSQRVVIAVDVVVQHLHDRIIMFCERLEQVNQLKEALSVLEIPCAVYTSKEDTIDRYMNGNCNILLTSRMIRQGFNDPSTTMGIVVSTPITELNQIQTLGRMVRYMDGKTAKIVWLLAQRTSDENLIRNGGVKGTVVDTKWKALNITPDTHDERNNRKYYHQGFQISFNGTELFSKGKDGRRTYWECNELIDVIRKNGIKRSGRFSLHETGVFTVLDDRKDGRKYERISEQEFSLVEKEHPFRIGNDSKITFDELFG